MSKVILATLFLAGLLRACVIPNLPNEYLKICIISLLFVSPVEVD